MKIEVISPPPPAKQVVLTLTEREGDVVRIALAHLASKRGMRVFPAQYAGEASSLWAEMVGASK